MTQERLRELLRERVAEETMPDYSAAAWRAARRVRRRHRLGVVTGVAAAAVGVTAGIAVVNSTPPAAAPPSGQSDPLVATPDATYEGVPVWWSPDQQQEQGLSPVDSSLPDTIDLDAAVPIRDALIPRAVAAFARGRSVVLVPPGGGVLRTVDVSRLQEVTKPNGYSYFPTAASMLSPTGAYLAFLQPGRVAVYTVATGAWSEIDAGGGAIDVRGGGGLTLTWVTDNQFVLTGSPWGGLGDRYDIAGHKLAGARVGPTEPAFDVSASQPYGRDVRREPQKSGDEAQSWGMGTPLPVRDSRYVSSPEFLVADGAVLAFMADLGDGQHSRYKDCCPVAGWLDAQTVVYESRQTDPVLVAWRLRSHDFSLVSRIRGDYDVASFAL